MKLVEKLDEAKKIFETKFGPFPRWVIVLGSGLGGLLNEIEVEGELAFSDIPHFRAPSVEGHRGRLVVGKMDGVRIACMQGRPHYYEGHSMEEVVFPVRAFAWAGAEKFLLTNASGGLKTTFKPPELVLIRDHINLLGSNPLVGPNDPRIGARFPDLSEVYDAELRAQALAAAKDLDIPLTEGVYLALQGPCYETPSESALYRLLGGDITGMSTVPEAIALRHMNKRVIAISCVTNLVAGASSSPPTHGEVLENADRISGRFAALVRKFLASFS